MLSRNRSLLLLCTLAVLISAYFAIGPRLTRHAVELTNHVTETTDPASGLDKTSDHLAGSSETLADPSIPVESGRQGSVPTQLFGRVVAESQESLAGITVSWSPIHSDDSALPFSWEALEAAKIETASDSTGGFSFPETAGSPGRVGSVLCIADPRYSCAVVPVEESRREIRIPLTSAHPLLVKVIDGEGRPASGAVVQWVAQISPLQEFQGPSVFVSGQTRTDARGCTFITRVHGHLSLAAKTEDRSSAPWEGNGEMAEDLILKLLATIQAEGSVTFPEMDMPRVAGVSAFSIKDAGRVLLGSDIVDAGGRWALRNLPFLPTVEYIFRLSGVGLVPQEHSILVSERGDIHLDFQALQGLNARLRITGVDGAPVPFARVTMRWRSGEDDFQSSHRADDGGCLLIDGAPEGDVWFLVEAPGYVPRDVGPYLSPRDLIDERSLIVLQAGHVRGRCLHDGAPVSDFTLAYWREPLSLGITQQEVHDSPDGSFLIDDAPLGPVFLYATSQSYPKGETVSVEVASNTETFVELHLPSPGRATGRVTDSATHEPVPDAFVEIYASNGTDPLARWGAPVAVGHTGLFDSLPVSPQWNKLVIGAPNYASKTYSGKPEANGLWECGEIPLTRRRTLELRLLAQGAENLGDYFAQVDNRQNIPRVSFQADGVALIEGVDPGHVGIFVFSPDLMERQELWTNLEADRDWVYNVSFDSGRRLLIRVVDDGGAALPETLYIFANYLSNNKVRTARVRQLGDDGTVTMGGIEGDYVTVDVWDSNYRQLAAVRRPLMPSGSSEVVVRLSLPERKIRFVDKNGQPLTSTQVIFVMPGDDTGWGPELTTNAAGECTLNGVEADLLFAEVRTAEGAHALGLRVPLDGPPEETVQVVVETGAGVQLRLLDGNEAVTGIRVKFSLWETGLPLMGRLSDETGLTILDDISVGSLIAFVDAPGYWPSHSKVEATYSPTETIMQVRRTGSIEVVVTRGGVPVAGAAVELVSDEFGESASAWLSGGRIRSDANGVTTDSSGSSRLFGLPNGSYGWQVSIPGLEAREGQVVVPPHGVERLLIEL